MGKARLIIFFICFKLLCPVAQGQNLLSSDSSTLVLDSVSVAPNNQHIVIGWTLQTTVQEGFIEIHRQLDNGLYAPVSQVPLSQQSFTDTGVDAGSKSYSYYIVARYPNGDNIAVSNEAHATIFLQKPEFLICDKMLEIRWESYRVTTSAGQPQPLPIPFDSYRILVAINGAEFLQVESGSAETEEFNLALNQEGKYTVKIQYISSNTGFTSTSNLNMIDVTFAPEPAFLSIRGVSVDENSLYSVINLYTDSEVPDAYYEISKYDPLSDTFDVLDTISENSPDITFTDSHALVNERSEIYIVSALDQCLEIRIVSEPVGSIFLSVESLEDFRNELNWNYYEGWPTGVENYLVQRNLEGIEFETVAVLPESANNFIDDFTILGEDVFAGEVRYRILAVEAMGNPFGFKDTVLSNIVRVERDDGIFIPSAINISSQISENRVFRPVFRWFAPALYNLSVYNRWGQRVFHTTDHLQGWDGRITGNEAPAGVYSFVLDYHDPENKLQKKAGTFLLMR
jgi:gliding motility-associated-like protein